MRIRLSTPVVLTIFLLATLGCAADQSDPDPPATEKAEPAATQAPQAASADTALQDQSASEVLQAGLAEAERSGKRVFLHSSAPW